MKIVSVTTHCLRIPVDPPIRFATRVVPMREFLVTQVETDEGIVGSSTVPIGDPVSIAAFVDRKLAPIVIGQDPFATQTLWHKMHHEVYRDRKGSAIRAVSAIDIALWDIKGKALDMPLFRLLGGGSNRVHCYASGGYWHDGKGVAGLVDEMQMYVDHGYDAAKIKIGAVSFKEDEARVKAARETLGPDRLLLIDANNGYATHEAMKVGAMLQEYDCYFFEEPVQPNNLGGSKRLADALPIPIAAGELEYTTSGFNDLIEFGGVDIIQPDATVSGGITEFMRIAGLAQAKHIPVAPHWEQEIHMHVVAALPNALFVEYFMREINVRVEDKLYEDFVVPTDGYLEIPDKPGLGMTLQSDALTRWRIDA